MGQNRPKSGPKLDFLPFFIKFGSLRFFEIAYNDSLQQCITFISQIGQNRAKN